MNDKRPLDSSSGSLHSSEHQDTHIVLGHFLRHLQVLLGHFRSSVFLLLLLLPLEALLLVRRSTAVRDRLTIG